VKADWKKSTLGNVLSTLKNGLNCKQSKDGAGQKISRIESIATAYFDINRVGFSEISESDKAKFKLLKGDILFSHINSPIHVGKTATFNEDEDVYHGVNLLLMRPNEEVLPAYLELYLKSLFESGYWLKRCKQSVNQASVNQQDIAQVAIEFPSNVTEQHRIVTLLDEAFADIATAKANAEKNLQNAREFFDNALQSLVDGTSNDWAQRTMAEVCNITSKLVDPREDQHLDLPHVGAGNIESKTSALVDVKTAREENLISGKFQFDESMVLYSKIRPYLMKVVRPDFNGLCSADIYPLAPKPGAITRDYLYYLLLAPTFTEYAIKGSARAGMPKVNREHLFAYQFLLPKVQDQKRITENLDQIVNETIRLESIYRQKLTALGDLKKSLLHQAFSGQL
jgi:type I restriction enzyme S subunit